MNPLILEMLLPLVAFIGAGCFVRMVIVHEREREARFSRDDVAVIDNVAVIDD